jgi:phospholipase C
MRPLQALPLVQRRVAVIATPSSTEAAGGHISHVYAEHSSFVKFVEHNWNLGTLTERSRDNLPNPVVHDNPYVPVNMPAIGDLFDMFDFSHVKQNR